MGIAMTRTTIWRWAVLAFFASGIFHSVHAEQASMTEQEKQTLQKIVASLGVVEALAAECDARSPENRESRQAMMTAWGNLNHVAAFQAEIRPIIVGVPTVAASIKTMRDKTAEQMKAVTEKTPTLCDQFEALLRETKFAIGDDIIEILPLLKAANEELAARTASAPPTSARTMTLYTIVQLSTAAEAAMNTIASADAAKDNEVGESRRKSGEAALEALGMIAVRARITGRDELREWRGEQQSTYEVSCRVFIDRETQARFKRLEGSEATISGKVDRLSLNSYGGGTIVLAKCALLDGAQMTKADLPESGGLELRPPAAEEANAGPGKGIRMRDVEKVVYKLDRRTSFSLGSYSMERREDTYVLLKDGTAYRHHWRFPFIDLDVPLVKRRDSANWYRWRQDGENLLLTTTGGPNEGQTKTVSGAVSLSPFPPGVLLDKTFQFLHVSAVGVRLERDYAFHRDGTIDLHKSNLFAGQTGPGADIGASGPGVAYTGGPNASLIVTGRPDNQRLRYRIDGYVLELTADDGAIERQLIARFGDDTADDPHSIYIGGQLLWDRDNENEAKR
jgi:hypothetical protein